MEASNCLVLIIGFMFLPFAGFVIIDLCKPKTFTRTFIKSDKSEVAGATFTLDPGCEAKVDTSLSNCDYTEYKIVKRK